MHKLLETHMVGDDWQEAHQQLTYKYSDLFDEHKEMLGDLPRECKHVMKSYLWHYKNDPWKVLETEFMLETDFPDGSIYRVKIDALIENQYGLWLVDHKTHKQLPDHEFRLRDTQSALYLWAAMRNKIKVQGFIWNYIRWKPPTVPQLLKDGSRLSRWWNIETDYITAKKAIKKYGLDPEPYEEWLERMKNQRYVHGEMQTSPFFRRDILEKSPAMLRRVAQENYHTSKRMHEYPWDKEELIERVIERSCTFSCSYTDICTLQIFGGNIKPLIKQKYHVVDPMSYYYDEEFETKEERG